MEIMHDIVINGFHLSFFSLVFVTILFALMVAVAVFFFVSWKKSETSTFNLRYILEQVYEVMFASPDGYFSWLYGLKNGEVREIVSHRLAVLLNLKKGIKSSFGDILDSINPDDKNAFLANVDALKNKGKNFAFEIRGKEQDKRIIAIGCRSRNSEKVLADTIWFRDITSTSNSMDELYSMNHHVNRKYDFIKVIIDKIPFPLWGRDKDLKITFCNQAYADAVGNKSTEEVVENKTELATGKVLLKTRGLAIDAFGKKSLESTKEYMVLNGNRHYVNLSEQYLPIEEGEFQCSTLGMALPIDDEGNLDAELKRLTSAHFGVLENLTTAIVIFDKEERLAFYNQPFVNLFDFPASVLDDKPFYSEFLDILREKRMLPESRDFKAYKSSELELFGKLLQPKESLLYLPMGKILRRFMIPYGLGGLLISYEDITDRKALELSYEASIENQRATIDNIKEAVVMFDAEENLNLYNSNYLTLWHFDKSFLDTKPKFSDIIELHRPFFTEDEAEWNKFKNTIFDTLNKGSEAKLRLERRDKKVLDVSKVPLADGGFLLAFDDITGQANEKELREKQIRTMSKKDEVFKSFISAMASNFPLPLKELSVLAGKLPSSALFVEKAGDIESSFADVMNFAVAEINAAPLKIEKVNILPILKDIFSKLRARAAAKMIDITLNCDEKISMECYTDKSRFFELLYYIAATSLSIAGRNEKLSVTAKAEEKYGKKCIKIIFSPHFMPSGIKNAENEYLGLGADLVKMNASDLSCEIKVERTSEAASYSLSVTVLAQEWS